MPPKRLVALAAAGIVASLIAIFFVAFAHAGARPRVALRLARRNSGPVRAGVQRRRTPPPVALRRSPRLQRLRARTQGRPLPANPLARPLSARPAGRVRRRGRARREAGDRVDPQREPRHTHLREPGRGRSAGCHRQRPICFSSDADLRQLLVKLAPFEAAGSPTFMVSFDDVQRSSAWPTRRPTVAATPRSGAPTPTCSTTCWPGWRPGSRSAPADRRLRLPGNGRHRLSARPARSPRRRHRGDGPAQAPSRARSHPRRPTGTRSSSGGRRWSGENWTTNDALGPDPEHPARIFLGPYARRADVVGHVGGFFYNPANQSDLNYLPLATAGRWMRDPAHYRPRRAFLHETSSMPAARRRRCAPSRKRTLPSSLRGSVEAPTLERLIRRFLRAPAGRARPVRAHRAAAVAHLRHGLRLAAHARGRLLRIRALHPFVRQARPFLRSVRTSTPRVGLVATDLLEAKHRAKRRHVRRHLHRALRRAARWPAESFGTRSGVYGLTGNVIDRYVTRVRERDRRR